MKGALRRETRLSPWQLAVWIAIAAGVACSDQAPSSVPATTAPKNTVDNLIAVSCSASRINLAVECTSPAGTSSAASSDGRRYYLIVGGQGTYIQLVTSAISYTPADSVFQFNVTVQNKLPQPMATTDGTTPDSAGVRLFFATGPTPTSGTGSVAVANADLIASYTAPNQPVFKYGAGQTGDGILASNETSTAKTWQLKMPPSVLSFEFMVYVAAEVPHPHGYVDVTPGTGFLFMDSSRTLTAVVRDALGRPIGGSVTWSTGDTSIAHVDNAGNVTGGHANAGPVTITATSGSLTGSSALNICPNTPIGSVIDVNFPTASNLCFGGGASGAEFVYVPKNLSSGPFTQEFNVTGTGVIAAAGPPTPDLRVASQLGFERTPAAHMVNLDDTRFIAENAARYNAMLANPASLIKRSSLTSSGKLRFSIPVAPPAVGDSVSYDTNQVCNASAQLVRGVIRSISNHLIIVADTANPANGFTTAQFDSIGAEFDSIAWPVDSANFGAPTDIDGNGHVIAFYTRQVNFLTPNGSTSIVPGLFEVKDVFAAPGQGCSNSNQKEIIFMMVPDPTGTVNSNIRTVSFVRSISTLTLGHEFQHLINAFRRAYVTHSSAFEFTFLNEGLSSIAEELMFYRMSAGLTPKAKITLTDLTSGPTAAARTAAFNTFMLPNFQRLASWLQRPDTTGPFRSAAPNSSASRGAMWSYLRFAIDKSGNSTQSVSWNALVNSNLTGFANIQNALGGQSPFNRLEEWVTLIYVDDIGLPFPPGSGNASWNYRSVYGGFGFGGFPIMVRPLTSGVGVDLVYANGGGGAFFRFGTAAGQFSTLTIVGTGATPAVPLGLPFKLHVVRTK